MPGSRFARFSLACLVAFLLAVPDADARGRQARARQGASKSGHAERTVTRTRPDGSTRTSTHDSSWQRGGGKYSRDTVHTGPGGKQGTTHDEVRRTEDGYTRETTHTGPNGGVTTRNATGAYDPETKTWSREKVVTRPDGSTSKTDVTTHVTPVVQEPAPAE